MKEMIEKTSIGPAVLKQYMKEAAAEGCRLVQIHANRMDGRYEQEMAELFGVKIRNIAEDPHVKLYHVKGHPMK